MTQVISQLLDMTGKVAIVTGASRGIGRAIARVFAAAGARVALAARSADQLKEVAAEMQSEGIAEDALLIMPTDVAIASQVEAMAKTVIDTWGQLDILVNNAGLIEFGSI
ncbi:MAG TPA: hypothetical protein DGN59_04550, partial [Candidatus Latescibacteria bacterium]|nr:hypothetical protein [Candidatus Latescibacterota bacterium]